MNENINLCEILKDCPKGTKFWSPIFGDVEFETLSYRKTQEGIYEVKYVVVKDKRSSFWFFPPNGCPTIGGVTTREVMLFPSKDCRDWSKWKCPNPKFDPKTLNPFDRVLVRTDGYNLWTVDLLSFIGEKDFKCIGGYFRRCIPYNDDTKHLVGTSDEAPEYYRYWED